MYGCGSWTIKKAERWRIDAFKLQWWRRLLRFPWISTNLWILKEINLEYSLEGLMLKLQYFGHLMWIADSLEKTLMLGKIEGRGKGTSEDEMAGWHHQPDAHEFEWTPGVGDGQGGLASCGSWGHKESDTTEWLNCTEDVDPRPVGTRRLMMLTPKIPPCYLTINHSENGTQAEDNFVTLSLTVFTNSSWKTSKHCSLLCHKPVSVDWLYCALGEQTQVYFRSIMHWLTELKELKHWIFFLFVCFYNHCALLQYS